MALILSGTNGLSDVDGTAATPAIRGTDTNTGIYFPGADRIGFAEGGTQVGEFDASGNFLMNSGYGSVAVAYGCRAWVNFNGTGTVAIRASGNVSSITDNGVGLYTVNFTTALPDSNYAVVIYNNAESGTGQQSFNNQFLGGAGARATTSVAVASYNTTALTDSALFDVVVFR